MSRDAINGAITRALAELLRSGGSERTVRLAELELSELLEATSGD